MTDLRAFVTIVLNDLRQRVRDKSVLIFGLLVPLAIIGLFSVLFGGMDDGIDLDPITVAVASPPDDEMATVLVDVLDGLEVVDVSIDEVGADAVRQRVDAGDAALGLQLPDDFGAAVTGGRSTEVRMVRGDDAGLEGRIVETVIDGTIDQIAAGTVAATAAAMGGVPADQLEAVGRSVSDASEDVRLVEGTAADEQLSMQAALVAGQAGLFLLFTVGFGVLSLIAEREQGTLSRLQSFPVRHGTVVAAKAGAGFVLGVLTTTTLLVAGALLFDTTFGALLPVAVLVAGAVAASTSLVFVVARIARTSEQATVAQSVIAMALGLAGGAFFPFDASGLVGAVLDINPVAALVRGLGITSGGGGLGDLGWPLAVLLGFAVVSTAAARLLPDRAAR